jgi:hypothetical protein
MAERQLNLVLLKTGGRPFATTVWATDGLRLTDLQMAALEHLRAVFPDEAAGLTLDKLSFFVYPGDAELRAALSYPASFVPSPDRAFPLFLSVGDTFVDGKDCVLVTATGGE